MRALAIGPSIILVVIESNVSWPGRHPWTHDSAVSVV